MPSFRLLLWTLASGLSTAALFAAPADIHQDSHGVTVATSSGTTRVEIWGERTVRVIHGPNALGQLSPGLAVVAQPADDIKWTATDQGTDLALSTPALHILLNKTTGTVRFLDPQNHSVLAESPGGSSLTPATVGGVSTTAVEQRFALDPAEALYGLGQQPGGVMNWVGHSVHLQQKNTRIAIPVLVSSKGYGVFWNNPAVTDVSISKVDAPDPVTDWKSEAGSAIDYYFFYGPRLDQVIAGYRDLTGPAPLFGIWGYGFWQSKQRYNSQAQLLDIAGRYRAMGVPIDGIIQDWLWWRPHPWGSHEFGADRYPDPALMMRRLHDENIHLLISVWAKFDIGTDNARQLDAVGALYPEVIPYVYPPGKGRWYDPFSPAGRRVYWEQLSKEIFSKGIDGWWLDGSEAELSGHWGEFRDYKTGAGPGALVYNAYPLMHTAAVYQGQRAETSAKRVFILTRSAYAGQQRNAAVAWSGDIRGNWDVFRQQIPDGINFCLSGLPYWNTDTGGFFARMKDPAQYPELFTRWFQFSAFCPMFRVHGDATHGYDEPPRNDPPGKEVWNFPPDIQKILIAYDQLRYHLIPYIYSVAWRVTSAGDTLMRGLVMDFPRDPKVLDIPDQYLFGPAIMACPVTTQGAKSRDVYLPSGTRWTDFWTGKTYDGGQTLAAAAPLETMPLFVRVGSIIPYAPAIQHASESLGAPLELRIYRGADGDFALYEDEGDNYDYERGAHATIPIHWDDRSGRLTLGARQGFYPGMAPERAFRIVWVSPGHGTGIASTEKPDAEIRYSGQPVTLQAPRL